MLEQNNVDVLIVEDNPHDSELFIRALKKSNMSTSLYVAVDGDEALSFLLCTGKFEQRRQNKAVKVIFLDLKLPKISGLEVLKEIKNHPITCKTPVVIVSSSAQDQDIKRAYELGANGYVVKPLDFNDFQTAMSAAGIYWLSVNEPPR
jgi:two-component system, response regulator